MFTNHIGKPTHPTVDHDMWKSLLKRAKVRDARLHDARHTAATMLLVLKVPLPAVMEIMGWSDATVAKRYMHVPNDLVAAIAQQVADLVWTIPDVDPDGDDRDDTGRLTDDQRTAVRRLTEALPEPWRSRLVALLDEGGDDPTGVLVPA